MPCPYAERKGALVYCKAAKKKVNPLTYPCLSKTRYVKCKYYREAAKKIEAGVKAKETPPTVREQPKPAAPPAIQSQPQAQPTITPPISASAPVEPSQTVTMKRYRTKGMTLAGRPARTCLECIYYGSRTKTCILLGIEVKDPFNPPCAEPEE
ncbi:MAG: hypothetical protein F7C35_07965 [Desulfurococcales archaeon]|nr:hypothetical protein [Desulfurococcales archaeon]